LAGIQWTDAASADLRKLDRAVALRIHEKLTWFCENLSSVTLQPLGGEWKGAYRLRVGDWRVVCTLEGEMIVVQFVAHRRDIYRIR